MSVRTSTLALLLVATASFFSAACGPADAPASSTLAERDTLADGRVVVRWASLPAPVPVATAPDLRIGSLDGSGPTAFGDVRGIAEGEDGTVYVLDFQAAELRAFGPDGAFQRVMARRGQGPGELMEPNGMLVGPEGRLWVRDYPNSAIIAFHPDSGEVARQTPIVPGYGYIWDGDIDDRGRFWKPWSHSVEEREPGVRPEPGLQEGESRSYYVRYDPGTETRDSIYLGNRTYQTLIVDMGGSGRMYMGMPFATSTHTAVDPDGHIWSAWSGEYRIARMNEAGDTVLVIDVDAQGPPVTEADRDAFLVRYRERLEPEVVATIEAGVADHFPERKPVLAGISTDRSGRLWVRRTTAEGEPTRFDVFDRMGEHLATVRTEAELFSYLRPAVGRRALYGVVRDELDVPYVVRVPLPEELVVGGADG